MTVRTAEERQIAQAALRRFANERLTPAELALEIDRWERERALLAGDLDAGDVSRYDEATLRSGIAYADHALAELEAQATRVLRAKTRPVGEPIEARFDRARYADLVGLAETLTASPAVKCGQGRYRIRCPWHEDRRPSLVIYPPGEGWWCPVCSIGGSDAASFAARFFNCTQLEGLRWVEEMAFGVMTG